MRTQTITLADFLLARIAEDERVARAVRPNEYLPTRDRHNLYEWMRSDYEHVACTSTRVLAECEAKRRIVARYEDCLTRAEDPDYPTGLARDQIREYEDFVLPALAAPYADHPDYRDDWRS